MRGSPCRRRLHIPRNVLSCKQLLTQGLAGKCVSVAGVVVGFLCLLRRGGIGKCSSCVAAASTSALSPEIIEIVIRFPSPTGFRVEQLTLKEETQIILGPKRERGILLGRVLLSNWASSLAMDPPGCSCLAVWWSTGNNGCPPLPTSCLQGHHKSSPKMSVSDC